MKSKIIICIAVLAMTLVSCLENDIVYDTDNLEFRTWEFVGPIAKLHAPLYESLKKALKDFDGAIEITDDGVVCVKYVENHFLEWSDDIGLRGENRTFIVPVASSPINGSRTFPVRLKSSTDEEHSYVKVADLIGEGKLVFTVDANNLTGDIIIRIPELTKNGMPFRVDLKFPPGQPNVSETDLDGYRLDKDEHHNLNVEIEFSVSDAPSGSHEFRVYFSLPDMDVSYMAGYFGQIDSDAEGEIVFDFLDELDFDGTVGFRDIQIDAAVTNWVGMSLDVSGDFFFDNKPEPLALNPEFDFLVTAAPFVGVPALKYFSSNIAEIEFESGDYPSELIFKVNSKTNPGGNPNNNVTNFIMKSDNGLLADVEFTLTVPLHIKMGAYNRKDTVNFDYNDLVGNNDDLVNNVEYMYVTLLVDNALPFDVTLKAYAINESGSFSDETNQNFSRIVFKDILANQKGQRIEIKLEADQLERFRTEKVKYIVLHTISKTQNEAYVKVTKDNYLNIDVSVRAKADIPSNIN